MKTILTIILLLVVIVGCQSQSYNYDSRIKEIIADSIDAIDSTRVGAKAFTASNIGDAASGSLVIKGDGAGGSSWSAIGGAQISNGSIEGEDLASGTIDSVQLAAGGVAYSDLATSAKTNINGLISDSLDAVLLPILLWGPTEVASTDTSATILTPTWANRVFWDTDSTNFHPVLSIGYRQVSILDSISFFFFPSIDGGEDGDFNLKIYSLASGVMDSVLATTTGLAVIYQMGLSVAGIAEGDYDIVLEIKTSSSSFPLSVYPFSIVGYYKLR